MRQEHFIPRKSSKPAPKRRVNGVDPDPPISKPAEQRDRQRLDSDYDLAPAVQRRSQNRK